MDGERKGRAQPKRTTGEIGGTKIVSDENGIETATLIPVDLPTGKEALEKFFADIFVDAFNSQLPLGPGASISKITQKDTSDLDFAIECPAADYLELAELTPLDQEFGRAMRRTGKFNMYTYARWIYLRVIKKKQIKYGPSLAKRVFLLLYVNDTMFMPTQQTIMCIQSLCARDGCDFSGVFILLTNGSDLRFIEMVVPYSGPSLPPPKAFDRPAANLVPGQASWVVDLSDVPGASPD
ncbi:hypothetical protein [Caulobacter sp. 17J65-9]|uniref:hypothetical protein n=1 Tax=Caulobacter sp. 17J65-9 TaxID=2709382 RepID=UPI0013CA561A|nr:hypothetical protein [Caulobacter sp. 17J65-9]NEX92991.1 hypothetical protein [Caulobacter sp. 17J65-9]